MNPNSPNDPAFVATLENLWQRHLPSTRERLDILDRAIQMALAGRLDEAGRAEAESAAHKLSGNLGMFGYYEAGEIASELEHIFKSLEPETIPHLVPFMQKLRALLAVHL